MTLQRAADLAGEDPVSFVFDTLIEDRAATMMIVSLMHEDDVEAILADPSTAIGSDQLGVTSPTARVHPRAYGTFARVLGWCVRDRGWLDLATAVHRMTGLPARILGLEDRGRIREGAIADLVMFDPAAISDASTYELPTARARGIEAVLVGGRFAIDGGRPIDPGLGRVLRRVRTSAG
jgi:N-acyl-D-amino-acid deacylase